MLRMAFAICCGVGWVVKTVASAWITHASLYVVIWRCWSGPGSLICPAAQLLMMNPRSPVGLPQAGLTVTSKYTPKLSVPVIATSLWHHEAFSVDAFHV